MCVCVAIYILYPCIPLLVQIVKFLLVWQVSGSIAFTTIVLSCLLGILALHLHTGIAIWAYCISLGEI